MAESRIFKGQRDRSVIDINDPVDVKYLHHQFPWVPDREIKAVIRQHGPDREAVQTVLERYGHSDDER